MSAQSPTGTTVSQSVTQISPPLNRVYDFSLFIHRIIHPFRSMIRDNNRSRIVRKIRMEFDRPSNKEGGGKGCSNLPDPFEPGFTRWILGTFKCGVHWKARTYSLEPCACVYFARVVALYLWNALFYCAREMSALLSLVPLFEQPRDNIVPSLIRHRSWTSHIVIRGGLCSRSTHLDSQPAIALILA